MREDLFTFFITSPTSVYYTHFADKCSGNAWNILISCKNTTESVPAQLMRKVNCKRKEFGKGLSMVNKRQVATLADCTQWPWAGFEKKKCLKGMMHIFRGQIIWRFQNGMLENPTIRDSRVNPTKWPLKPLKH